jgi:Protein of unknown function (DUF1573)
MRQLGRIAGVALAAVFFAAAARAQQPAPAKAKPADTKAAAKPVTAPRIDITPETKDAGTVPKGQVIDATFVIKNTGGSDLILTDARPGCGCTVASFDKVIKPGEEGKVISHVDTKSFSGPIAKSILVVSNDPDRPQVNLFIKAVVKPFVDVLPNAYVRFSVVKGDSDSQNVILLSEEKSFKPAIAEAAQPYVKAEISPAGDKDKIAGHLGEQYKLKLTVTGDAPEGLLNAPIRINTGVTQQPTLEIPVAGIVRARLQVTPVLVNFGNFTAGKDPITRNIIITNNKPAVPIKITRVESSVAGFLTDIVPTQEGVSYTVVVKPTDKVKKGPVDGVLKLFTTDKEKAVIELPLKGEAL